LCTQAELPARREAELRNAAEHLGLKEVHILGYADKQLSKASTSQIRLELVQHIRAHRPHVVITFDPNGMNGHPDHVAISRFTMDAVVYAGDPRCKISATDPHTTQRILWTTPVLPWDVTATPDLDSEPGVDFVVNVSFHLAAKIAALRSHRTQKVPIDRCFFNKPNVNEILGIETFRQACGPTLTHVPLDDIFAGIDLSK
jgi:LmbE family N-acetylglucosaminyl deacetylase